MVDKDSSGPGVEAGARRRGAVWCRLLLIARPYWPHIAGCLALSLLAIPLALLTPLPLKIVVDSVLDSKPLPIWLATVTPGQIVASGTALLLFAVALLIATMLLQQLLGLASWVLQTYTGQWLVLEFRGQLFRHTQRLSLAYHDRRGSTDSTYRIQYDAPAIESVTITGLMPLVTAAGTLAGMIWVTASLDWQLALLALAVVPVLFVLTMVFGERARRRWNEVLRIDSTVMSVVQETLAALRVVKAFGSEAREGERFTRHGRDMVRKQLDVALVQGGYDLLVGLTLAIGTAAALFLGVHHVRTGVLSLGELLMVMAYLAMLYEPLQTLSKKIVDLQAGLASAERAFALLDEIPEVIEHPKARALRRAHGAIEFRDVSFAYADGHPILHGVSFQVPAGARVGIQGVTGSGKTTLMSLLTRFYDPRSGAILLDGVDLREYRLKDLREQFAIVLQEPVLFSTTIADNIAYGRPAASESDIVAAAKLANAHEFIEALPEGYRTEVGERGMRLSGGERQRIALARAFVRDAPILILDEPTSAIDVGTEAKIVEAMERLMHGRTTFMIAHRLSTLESCDLRLRVEGGRVVTMPSPGPVGPRAVYA